MQFRDTPTDSAEQYKATLSQVPRHLTEDEMAGRWGPFENSSVGVELKITRNGEYVFVPYSCFSDLCNVNSLSLVPEDDGCLLLIDGGDASEGYHATIRVVGESVVERIVKSGEFPEEHNSVFTYTNRVPND